MNHNLSVTVRVDVDRNAIQLVVTGCLTEDSQQTLLSLIRKARGFDLTTEITVDLSSTRHIEAAGIEQLRSAVDLETQLDPARPVLLVVPDELPTCPMSSGVMVASVA